jgi:hypothetical protein
MTDPSNRFVQLASEGGMAATLPVAQESGVVVAPTTGNEFNTVIARIIPVACWRVDDIRFEFDSSIVQPAMHDELRHLAALVRQHPPPSRTKPEAGCPLSIFGHADPTGNDDYNKQLSGRRAKAVYALLTRRTDLWEKLYSQPFGNDNWGKRALEIMLGTVAPGATANEAVAQHERDRGKRASLFAQYMDKLCGPDLKLEAGDFLGGGEDAGGKGDYQGCSEFNPVKLFSQAEQKKLDQAEHKQERNALNAPNRRVVALIFRSRSRVSPQRWPCPRADEGTAGCRKRFWADGEKRRAPAADARTIEKNRDTFACRFYDRLTFQSPCDHSNVTGLAPIVLDDPMLGPAKGLVVQLSYEDGLKEQSRTDARGVLIAKTSHGAFVDLTYDRDGVVGSGRVFILPPAIATDAGAWQRLVNLGYTGLDRAPVTPPTPEHLALAVEEFQSEFGQPPTGQLDDETRQLIVHAHDEDKRAWMEREWQDDVDVGPDATESKARIT